MCYGGLKVWGGIEGVWGLMENEGVGGVIIRVIFGKVWGFVWLEEKVKIFWVEV